MDALTLKRHNSFQNQNNRKAIQNFVPTRLIFRLQQELLKLNKRELVLSKTDLVTNFLNPENPSFENVSIVTFK